MVGHEFGRACVWLGPILFLYFALYNCVGGDQIGKYHQVLTPKIELKNYIANWRKGNEVVKLVSGVVGCSVVMVWCTVVLANRLRIGVKYNNSGLDTDYKQRRRHGLALGCFVCTRES